MNIAVISNHGIFPPTTGGARVIYGFIKFLSLKNKVIFFGPQNSRKLNDLKNIEIEELFADNKFKFLNLFWLFKLVRIIKKKKIEVIIMNYPWFGLHLYLIRKMTGVKVYLYEHNIEFLRFKSNKYWWWKILYYYEKFVYQFVDDVLFISPDDRTIAEKKFKIKEKGQSCPYGIDQKQFNNLKNLEYKEFIKKEYGLREEKIILFFGKLNYEPNQEAIKLIFEEIYPLLKKEKIKFKILICGKNPPEKYVNLKKEDIIFTGLVDAIEPYIKGCDLMINPIISGGGVKTKVIESLACGKTVISTENGAKGIEIKTCTNKLVVVKDWQEFVEKIVNCLNSKMGDEVSESFLEEYEWGNIIKKLKF